MSEPAKASGGGSAAKVVIVGLLAAALIAVVVVKGRNPPAAANAAPAAGSCCTPAAVPTATPPAGTPAATVRLPRLVDLGAGKCIPCKLMAPILADLKKEYAGRLDVQFVDVWENPDAATPYNIKIIPTQIFCDATGQERFRHEGFFAKEDILGKWKELGVDLGATAAVLPKIERWEPTRRDERTADQVCYLCDGDVNPKTAVVVKTDKGDVRLCGPHCYFIMYSCLTQDKTTFEQRVSVTDFATGQLLPATAAVWVTGAEEKTGRPWIKAFADREAATKDVQAAGGNIVAWNVLQDNELSHRCGFCDRAVYPQDVGKVLVEGVQTYGCCAHCAMGVAARTGKDIEVYQPDGLTGQMIAVKTLGGRVASIEPKTAVAWFGKRQGADGKWLSAGCFHQGFFATPENLKTWLEQHPFETGEMISIQQSLADKMKLKPEQIQKACKIGECAPKPAPAGTKEAK